MTVAAVSTPKDRVRVQAPSVRTGDSFQNLKARLGIGADNLISGSNYALNPVTRNRGNLEFAYRGSWIARMAVDIPADDMTREGLLFEKGVTPNEAEQMHADMSELGVMNALAETIGYARLYGGACGYIMIDGQEPNEELRIDRLEKGAFKGILAFDRWQLQPSFSELIEAPGPDLGLPKFYDVLSVGAGLNGKRIHHTRMLRFDGDKLPYWQRRMEMGWGASVIEALYDRLVMFDSTSTGMAQMVFRAHLRTIKIEGLRTALANAGKAMEGVAAQLDYMRSMQTIEGLSVIDAKDAVESQTYTFSGLSDCILQAGQQLAGALQIPLVRLFGQSPAGLNSTGESDLRTYYDGIASKQRRHRRQFSRLARIMHVSSLGRPNSSEFDYKFAPLYELSAKEKAEIAVSTTSAVSTAVGDGLLEPHLALKELKQSSEVTGVFTNISEEDIEKAKLAPPPAIGLDAGGAPGEDADSSDEGDAPAPDQRKGEAIREVE